MKKGYKLKAKNLIPLIREGVLEQFREREKEKMGPSTDCYAWVGRDVEIHKANMIAKVVDEYVRASKLHAPFNSPHEGYAIIKEEVDEMWDCIKANEVDHARRESMQICAMALRFLIDIKPDPKSP